ncbi:MULTISPECIES: ribosomal protection-like ABC-F family protein [unclassified Campylobacter]|uniref:ribosomal protection-like ABC-F family protein n=1 Tax=unclassified Campylobacter TaxID=2593542 RepID=UPI0022E9C21B|nr:MULTISPECIES: ABC-F family ATP-binding cassette domain-containing protein [unclassified Campylobacter]MDA3053740.1 ABC-F family ATP-binding cassette domain-containing protein [Campylobacter sp. VBCF_07 NA4]MDA3060371.1 ABC-F family ATP-binding cassette domain-containing protein [Campylobacter sp. VBCF_02 NA5]MDA3069881.1 ABC-F family ATP-binding cassette domain-containing protein [Campylobacter sp. VBCF_08 NA3]MDA3078343.1 ABC-F family ATP-binding cassette domain-containing protein [Campylob
MALVDLIDVVKKFGSNTVLDGVNFSLSSGERVAIIGKNGGGKSTLMKIIAGEYEIDGGRVITQNGINIQMLEQSPKFDDNLSVKDALKRELKEIYDAIDEYNQILEQISNDPQNEALLTRQNELNKFIDAKDGWNIDNKIERILEHFGLKIYENRSACTLSGGEIRRVALGALVLKKPDILLLDEPTNHLDVYMVRFLEDMLLNSKQTILFISHDRYFIDKLATRSIEIEEGKLSFFDGGYENYLRRKQEILASLQKSHETLLKQLKYEEEWLHRGVKARLKRDEGRKARVLAMREEAKKNPGVIRRVKLELERASRNFNGTGGENRKKMLFECKNVSKILNGKDLFKGFSARVLQGERIGIVGANGAGKSTLIKMLIGKTRIDGGEIKRGDIKIGYFDQARSEISGDKSLIEIFCPNGGDHIMVRGHYMHVYGYLKNFLFPKEFLDKPVSVLSGGEKNRVALAKLFTEQYDCLILDEPTNDLDIATINILEDYLLSFEGAVIIVSHDRYFIDKITNKLWAFEKGKIEQIYIPYSEYLEYEDEIKDLEIYESEVASSARDTAPEIKENKKEKTATTKLSYKQNKILEEYPAKIEEIENRIKELNHALSTPEIYQQIGLQPLFEELEEKKGALNQMENEYFEVLSLAENLK